MFGFGDSRVPDSDTRAAVEAIVLEYMIDLVRCAWARLCIVNFTSTQCESALDLAEDDNVTVDHLLAVVNSTGLTPKYARAQDLLASLKQIKSARTAQLADDKVENSVVKLQAAAAANAARTKQSRSRAKGGAKARSRKKQKS